MRPNKPDYYLEIAKIVLKRGTCIRRNYGAVIVKDDQKVATGYTGSPRGCTNCCDTGMCTRKELKIPSGERYELCCSVHAEVNACLHAGREKTIGATLYLVGWDMKNNEIYPNTIPCDMCKRVIINAGIQEVIVDRGEEIMRFLVSDWLF